MVKWVAKPKRPVRGQDGRLTPAQRTQPGKCALSSVRGLQETQSYVAMYGRFDLDIDVDVL